MNDANQDEDREIEEPQEPVDPPQEKNPHRRKPAWVREAIQGTERYGDSKEMHRERKRTTSYSSYVSLLCDIIDEKPSNYEKATEKKEWKDDVIADFTTPGESHFVWHSPIPLQTP